MLSDGWSEPRCPTCQAEEEAEQERQKTAVAERLVHQRAEHAKEDRIRRAEIPPRFAAKDFSGFVAGTEEERKALAACQEYVADFTGALRVGRCLILYGKPGTGKTHLACSIANAVTLQQGYEARYLTFIKAVRSVKQTYSKASELTEQQALDDLTRPDLLVLDEVGVQFGSDTEKMLGFEVVNARYEAMRPTIIISNLGLRELTECLGDRVIDRLRENGGKLIPLTGDSHRGDR